MLYFVKSKMLGLGGTITIENDRGEKVFWIQQSFSGEHYCFREASGQDIVSISQTAPFMSRLGFRVHRDGKELAFIRRKTFPLLKDLFTVDVQNGDSLIARGDYGCLRYEFYRGEKLIAFSSKKWSAQPHNYFVDIAHRSDDVLILSCTLMFYSLRETHSSDFV